MIPLRKVVANDKVKEALVSFSQRLDALLELAIEIQQIPSPTGHEEALANLVELRFQDLKLSNVHQDDLHNVFGRATGRDTKAPLVVSAHMDTVFPLGTDLSIRYVNGSRSGEKFIYGPGLADNALGVAGLISLAATIKEFDISTQTDIWFVANVAEEGLGNLKGMRAVVDRFGSDATYIVLEGGSFGHIFHQAIGVQRFRISVETGGGHSWGDFGNKNAIHELSKIITELDQIELPRNPKTTLNVGVIEGGTTVNSIAARASCQLDLRSVSSADLDHLVSLVTYIVECRSDEGDLRVVMSEIGSRPAGLLSRDSELVKLAKAALQQVGFKTVSFMAGSTDANIPISRGIPAVCIGLASSANTHRLDEYLDPKYLVQGLSQLLLLALAVSGLEDGT